MLALVVIVTVVVAVVGSDNIVAIGRRLMRKVVDRYDDSACRESFARCFLKVS